MTGEKATTSFAGSRRLLNKILDWVLGLGLGKEEGADGASRIVSEDILLRGCSKRFSGKAEGSGTTEA